MIRRAKPDDKMRIIRLLKNAHFAASLPFQFSAPHASALFDAQSSRDDRLCLVLDMSGEAQGVLMAAATPHPFAPVLVASEVVWWVEPDHRGRQSGDMLTAYEEWAESMGCAMASMAALSAAPRAGVIYQRRGYRPAETHYIKAL